MSSSASPSSSKLQPQSSMPFSTHDHYHHNHHPSPTHEHTNEQLAIANRSMDSFKHSDGIKPFAILPPVVVPDRSLSLWISPSFAKFPPRFHSGTMLHFHTALQALHSSYKLPLSALEETTFHTITHSTCQSLSTKILLNK